MEFDTALAVIGAICFVLCMAGRHWCSRNVYLKYKEQRVVLE